jgi:hypothetical protein
MVLQLVKAHRALVRAHVPNPAPMLRADGTAIAEADAQSVRVHALKHAVANGHVEFSSGAQCSHEAAAATAAAAALHCRAAAGRTALLLPLHRAAQARRPRGRGELHCLGYPLVMLLYCADAHSGRTVPSQRRFTAVCFASCDYIGATVG